MVDNSFSREELFQSFVLLILLLDRSLLRRFRCGSVWKHLLSSDWGESCSQRQRVLLLCVLLFKCARSVWIMREVFCCFGGSFLGQILFKKFTRVLSRGRECEKDVHWETFSGEHSCGTSQLLLIYARARKAMNTNDSSNPHRIIKGPTKSVNNELITLYISSRGGN